MQISQICQTWVLTCDLAEISVRPVLAPCARAISKLSGKSVEGSNRADASVFATFVLPNFVL